MWIVSTCWSRAKTISRFIHYRFLRSIISMRINNSLVTYTQRDKQLPHSFLKSPAIREMFISVYLIRNVFVRSLLSHRFSHSVSYWEGEFSSSLCSQKGKFCLPTRREIHLCPFHPGAPGKFAVIDLKMFSRETSTDRSWAKRICFLLAEKWSAAAFSMNDGSTPFQVSACNEISRFYFQRGSGLGRIYIPKWVISVLPLSGGPH